MNKVYDENVFLSNLDDNEIIYWVDEGVYYKFPNRITEENKDKVECFDAQYNRFVDFTGKTVDEIVNYCFESNYSFGHEIGMSEYDNVRNGVIKGIKEKS